MAGTGAEINTIEADAGDPEGLGARMTELYRGDAAPGVIIYNAVMGAPDQLLSSSMTRKHVIQHQQIANDILENVKMALAITDPTPYFCDKGVGSQVHP